MRNRTSLGLAAFFSATALFAACGGDDPAANPPAAGATGGASGGSTATAGATATAGSTSAGTGGTGGSTGGSTATAGTGGNSAGTGGTGGTPVPIDPTVFHIDNVILRPKGSGAGGAGGAGGADAGGAGGAAGADAGGAAGAPAGGAGGAPAGGAAGAPAGGAAGAGGAGPAILPDFNLTFDANVSPLALGPGFSPGPGGSGGPGISNATTFVWEANAGNPGGAGKFTVPFSVATQQADIQAAFAPPADLTGYEMLADVKLTTVGTVGDCASAWLYVYGGSGFGNDEIAEPALGEAEMVTEGEWVTIRLDLDGPYGHHSTPGFEPTGLIVWGIHAHTWGCE